jgi:hypothetical protein
MLHRNKNRENGKTQKPTTIIHAKVWTSVVSFAAVMLLKRMWQIKE